MRERVQVFFGSTRKGRGDREDFRKGGQQKRGGTDTRLPVSESLARSGLVKGGTMPIREAALIVALISHPALIEENYGLIEMLDLSHPGLEQLHGALLDALAHDVAGDRDAMLRAVRQAGLEQVWEQAVDLVRRVRSWPALDDAALDDARDAFAQALHLHRSQRTLHRELKAAELALASESTEKNFLRLLDIQAQFRDIQATEALIEGFGVQSGRAGRN
jgi:DNA primase